MTIGHLISELVAARERFGDRELLEAATFGRAAVSRATILDGDHVGYPGTVVLFLVHGKEVQPASAGEQ